MEEELSSQFLTSDQWEFGRNNEDKPGLAITRSIGDHDSRNIGIIWNPEIYYHKLTSNLTVLVIWSDGVFGVMSNKDIADIVWINRAKSADEVAQIIVKEANTRWKIRDLNIDDWTWVIAYLSPS